MVDILSILPSLEADEMLFIQQQIRDLSEEKARQFASIYSSRRRDPQLILVTALIGFVGISGVQRFLCEQIGMGLLYLFTGGLCLIGTIIDLINYKKLAFEYNQKVAQEVAMLIKSFGAK